MWATLALDLSAQTGCLLRLSLSIFPHYATDTMYINNNKKKKYAQINRLACACNITASCLSLWVWTYEYVRLIYVPPQVWYFICSSFKPNKALNMTSNKTPAPSELTLLNLWFAVHFCWGIQSYCKTKWCMHVSAWVCVHANVCVCGWWWKCGWRESSRILRIEKRGKRREDSHLR